MGAVVRDSIIMFDSVIRPGAIVDRAILDKEVTVGPGAIVGEGTDFSVANRVSPSHLASGITIIGKRAVLPRGINRVAIEAGVTDGWRKYVGLEGAVIGLDRFGESAPAGVLFKEFGFTVANVVATVKTVI